MISTGVAFAFWFSSGSVFAHFLGFVSYMTRNFVRPRSHGKRGKLPNSDENHRRVSLELERLTFVW